MDGGFGDWEDAHYPFVQPPPPSEDEGPVNKERLSDEIDHLEAMIEAKKVKLQS
jgi:3-mercaptopyruvate sulfurtransferase SseA